VAIRKFGPFEAAIQDHWAAFCRISGCRLPLEAEAMDLPELHRALFAPEGLKGGGWDVAFIVTDWLAEAAALGALADLGPRLKLRPPPDYPEGWTDSLLRYQRFGEAVLGLPFTMDRNA
jgi:multiple sugar transport system substrate-binding protein